MRKVWEEISIKNLANVVETNGFSKGTGIENFGGDCIKLNMEFPKSLMYIICTNDQVKFKILKFNFNLFLLIAIKKSSYDEY